MVNCINQSTHQPSPMAHTAPLKYFTSPPIIFAQEQSHDLLWPLNCRQKQLGLVSRDLRAAHGSVSSPFSEDTGMELGYRRCGENYSRCSG